MGRVSSLPRASQHSHFHVPPHVISYDPSLLWGKKRSHATHPRALPRTCHAGAYPHRLWAVPTGDLLVSMGDAQLWHSSDHGATWAKLPGSALPPPMVTRLTARAQYSISAFLGQPCLTRYQAALTWARHGTLSKCSIE